MNKCEVLPTHNWRIAVLLWLLHGWLPLSMFCQSVQFYLFDNSETQQHQQLRLRTYFIVINRFSCTISQLIAMTEFAACSSDKI